MKPKDKKKVETKRPIWGWIVGIIAMAMIPIINGFGEGLPMMNLWDLFVENMFGSFVVAVLFIALVLAIIMMLGNISFFTILIFLYYYFLAMAMGYGINIVTVFFVVISVIAPWFQLIKFSENR